MFLVWKLLSAVRGPPTAVFRSNQTNEKSSFRTIIWASMSKRVYFPFNIVFLYAPSVSLLVEPSSSPWLVLILFLVSATEVFVTSPIFFCLVLFHSYCKSWENSTKCSVEQSLEELYRYLKQQNSVRLLWNNMKYKFANAPRHFENTSGLITIKFSQGSSDCFIAFHIHAWLLWWTVLDALLI